MFVFFVSCLNIHIRLVWDAKFHLCILPINKLYLLHFCVVSDTMMKFASFETIVEKIYKYAIPTPKEQCSKTKQLGVSFAAGYIAGVLCAIVSHPADNLVSFLNNAKGATVGDVSNSHSTHIDSNIDSTHSVLLMLNFLFNSFWILQAVKKIGVVGLFTRGLPLRIVMIGTLTGAQWGLYDSFKVFVGL